MKQLSLGVVLFASLAGQLACGPGFDVPETESCNTPSSASPASFEVYNFSYDSEVEDGGVLQLIQGDQGGTMAVLQYRGSSAGAPGCVRHETTLSACSGFDCTNTNDILAQDTTALPTFQEGAGWHTSTLFLILNGYATPGSLVRLDVSIGDRQQSLELYFETEPSPLVCDGSPGALGSACDASCSQCTEGVCTDGVGPDTCNKVSPFCPSGVGQCVLYGNGDLGLCLTPAEVDCVCSRADDVFDCSAM